MRTTLVVGDWSDDGHGKTEHVTVEHNLRSAYTLHEAYHAGCIILGVQEPYWDQLAQETRTRFSKDVMYNHVANEYRSPVVPGDVAAALEAHGIAPVEDFTYFRGYGNYTEQYYVADPEGYARIWMEIAKLAAPELEYDFVELDTINIGGYGCFN